MRTRPGCLIAVAYLLGAGIMSASPASAAGLGVTTVAADLVMTNGTASAVPVTATCPGGMTLVGGGSFQYRFADANPPTTGLKMNGTIPSDPAGNPVADGTADPASWTTVAGFGGQSETGDKATVFAMCAAGGPPNTIVKTATVTGVAAEGAVPVKAVASCPPATRLVGGGALGTPPTQPNLKPIASYPSDASGVAVADGATNPGSWAAFGSGGAGTPPGEVTAFAVCSTTASPAIQVARVDASGPQTALTFTTTPVACPPGTSLLDGGVMTDKNNPGVQPQQAVHLRGNYPSDLAGAPVAGGTGNPDAWTAVVHAGGQNSPGTNVHVFALCATEDVPPVVPEARLPILMALTALGVMAAPAVLLPRRRATRPSPARA